MAYHLSRRVQLIKPSPTLAVTALAARLRAEGKDVIGLGAGEPDFDTPEPIKQAAIEAIHEGKTKYTAVDGTPELKQAIIDKLQRDNQLSYTADQILVSCGGKQSFFNLCLALLNPEDEVIVPAPYWVSYPEIVRVTEATPVIIQTRESERFKLSPDQLENAITPNTRLLVLNSPSNPTGVVYSADELRALGEVLLRHPQVLIASDDMYEKIVWCEHGFTNILNVCPALYDRTFTLNGVSKAYAMTGWRIGYAAGPAEVIRAMKKVQSQSTSNPASISQAAATAALCQSQDCVDTMKAAFKDRHDYVIEALNRIPGFECIPGDAAFYAFPNVTGAIARLDGIEDDVALAEYLINQAGVAVVPGSAFGAPGYLRLSFATGMDTLKEAIRRIGNALSRPA